MNNSEFTDIESSKNKFIEIFRTKIARQRSDKLLEWLIGQDMFTAPASTRFHLCREGGLCEHSIHVYERLLELMKIHMSEDGELTDEQQETAAIVGLLHDICKVNYYSVEMRNRKDENGKWIQVPFYTVEDKFPYGHGDKSVYIISKFMPLKTDEALAIRFHMGAYQEGDINNCGKVFEKCRLAFLAHIADMESTYLDESEST